MLNKLKDESKCVVIAPSNSIKEKDYVELERGEEYIKSLGLEISHSNNLEEDSYTLKAKDVENAFSSDADIIMAARGGENLDLILPYIDYSKITEKILCGFSDITSLLNQIYYIKNIITFHGCNVKTFGRIDDEKMLKETFEDFENKFFENNFTKYPKVINLKGIGEFKGRILGGNLSCFVKFTKLNKDLDISSNILILEELGFESKREDILRSLDDLVKVKGFEKVAGIIVGNYESIEDEKYRLEDILLEYFKDMDINIVKGDFFGHSKLNLIIPIGAMASVKDTIFNIEEKILK